MSGSITKTLLFDPIMSLSAPAGAVNYANPGNQPLPPQDDCCWHVFESEVITRCLAIFISVFSAVDAVIEFACVIYRVFCFVLECGLAPWDFEIEEGLKKTLFFMGLTICGSVIGVIWPTTLDYFFSQNELFFVPLDVNMSKLKDDIQNARLQASLISLKRWCRDSSLDRRREFVRMINGENSPQFQDVRTQLAPAVYKPLNSNHDVVWLSPAEVDQRIVVIAGVQLQQDNVVDDAVALPLNHIHLELALEMQLSSSLPILNQTFYYHGTPTSDHMHSILLSTEVQVLHNGSFEGAFASTIPEKLYGPFYLGFRRNIEHLSPILHGFPASENTYWSGFSKPIPVTKETVACILYAGKEEEEEGEGSLLYKCMVTLASEFSQSFGSPIQVFPLERVQHRLDQIRSLNQGIPIEWPVY